MQLMEFFLIWCILTVVIIHCKAQPGFINIDCGYSGNRNYTNSLTGLTYVPDAQYIDTGENHNISSAYISSSLAEQNINLRSFPSGKRNCYSLNVDPGKKYLIRAGFMYGNYDGLNRVPQFDFYVGVIRLGTMVIKDGSFPHGMEVMIVASNKIMPVCLVNIDFGTPFISSLELRLLNPLLYTALNESNYFLPFQKLDMGSLANRATRFPDDLYDRMWFAGVSPAWIPVNTSSNIITFPLDGFNVPSTVLRTAVKPSDNFSIHFTWNMTDPTSNSAEYDIFIHFAEIESNASRIVDVYLNDEVLQRGFTPHYLKADTISITNLTPRIYNLTIAKAAGSALPPLLNAIEAYGIGRLTELATDDGDVDAIMDVKSIYHLEGWMGDPCVPRNFTWNKLNCSFGSAASPRIIYINLANSALSGEIALSFAKFTELTYLDLSGNSLTGSIPDALGQLPSLGVLNLSNNHLSGSIPDILQKRSAKGSLILHIDGNPDICQGSSCKKKTLAAIITAVVIVVVLIVVMMAFLLWRSRRNRHMHRYPSEGKDVPDVQRMKKIQSILPENQQFTYEGLVVITGNFEHPIGRGGFGTVYFGTLGDGTQVAVKVRSQMSSQGKREFEAEAQLLTRIHHKNLVSLVGYCNNDNYLALVYEYMAEGSLEDHLRGKTSHTRTLKWIERLRIAIEAAQGLEYLHSGCKPPVIHRDVKSNNILLDHKREAKIADFGLSKVFDSDATHISTNVVGTEGYLDPELTDKSDVFSFGVVLLELISGLPPIIRNPDRGHISHWISPMLARGDIGGVVDDRMQHEFNSNSVWKTAEIAMKCTRPTSADRPTMGEVVIKLKESFALEISSGMSVVRDTAGFDIDLSDSFESPSKIMTASMLPHVR